MGCVEGSGTVGELLGITSSVGRSEGKIVAVGAAVGSEEGIIDVEVGRKEGTSDGITEGMSDGRLVLVGANVGSGSSLLTVVVLEGAGVARGILLSSPTMTVVLVDGGGVDGEAFGWLEEKILSPNRLLPEESLLALGVMAKTDTKAAKITTPATIAKLHRIVLVCDRLRRKCPQKGVVLITVKASSSLLSLVVSISSSSLIMIESRMEMFYLPFALAIRRWTVDFVARVLG